MEVCVLCPDRQVSATDGQAVTARAGAEAREMRNRAGISDTENYVPGEGSKLYYVLTCSW